MIESFSYVKFVLYKYKRSLTINNKIVCPSKSLNEFQCEKC